MSSDAEPDRRPGFLLGQPFWAVTAKTADARWSLAANEADPGDGDGLGPGFRPPPDPEEKKVGGGDWESVPRDELVRRAVRAGAWKRVGLVCGAGLGKTTTLEWLESAVNRLPAGQCSLVAFYRELEGMPADGEELLAELAVRFRTGTGIDHSVALDHLKTLRSTGRVLLLLDSLDQADPDPKGPAVAALKNLFGGPWSGCPIWVSGRPYAFRQAGPALRKNHPNQSWAFVRVGQLATPECKQLLETTDLPDLPRKQYPTQHRFDALAPAARRFARVPRYGRLIAKLPPDSLNRLTSEAAVFRALYGYVAVDPDGDTGLLDDGLRPKKGPSRLGWNHLGRSPDRTIDLRRRQTELAHAILGATAFEMFAQGTGRAERHHLFCVVGNIEGFKKKVRDRLTRAGAYLDCADAAIPPQYFLDDWNSLLAMDSHGLKNFIFSADGRDGRLRWTDVSTAAYFAAWWACRWGGDDEWGYARRWVVDPLTDENAAFREFWEMACDLPADANPGRRIELLSLLYATPDAARPTARSTEFIERTWDLMKGTPAQQSFLADPNRLRLTTDPEWIRGFIALATPTSKLPRDTGEFVMGAPATQDPAWDTSAGRQVNPEHLVRLSEYALHQFCVTNREYELFDPRHANYRWGPNERHPSASKKKPHADDDCPVVMVSWFDARCFVRWLGEVEIDGRKYELALPTEAQWEYACRTGRKSPFTFDDEHDGESCPPDLCNFNGKYPFPEEAERLVKTLPEKIVYRGHTIPVAELGPNPWGFHQMHGNVWEWCTDWYLPTFYPTGKGCLTRATENPVNLEPATGRVLRGGSWYSGGRGCRSAFRSRDDPANRARYCGFRLAAVPVGAKSGKRSGRRSGGPRA